MSVAGVARCGASFHSVARLAHAVHDDDETLVEGRVREHRPRVREVVRDLVLWCAWQQVVRRQRRLRVDAQLGRPRRAGLEWSDAKVVVVRARDHDVIERRADGL